MLISGERIDPGSIVTGGVTGFTGSIGLVADPEPVMVTFLLTSSQSTSQPKASVTKRRGSIVLSLMIKGFTLALSGSMATDCPLSSALLCPIHSSNFVDSRETVTLRVASSQPTSAPSGVAAYLMGSMVRLSTMVGLTSILIISPLAV